MSKNYLEELEKGKYGSIELKYFVGKNLMRGLVISLLIHSAVVASPYIVTLFKDEIPPPPPVVYDMTTALQKLKKLDPNKQPPKIARPKLALPKVVVPIAVKEDEVPEEQPQMMKQEEIVEAIVEDYGTDTLAIDPNAELVIQDDGGEIPGFDQFIPFEVPPQPLPGFSPQPAYPKMAQQAGVAGKVTAQVYVDKKGEVKKWRIVQAKPDNLGFQDEVEKILPEWKFTPAIQQGNPVGVWIAIPFNFKVQ